MFKTVCLALALGVLASMASPLPLAAFSTEESTAAADPQALTIAPVFELENIDGETTSLDDFRGEVIILALTFGDKAARDVEQTRRRFIEKTGGDIKFLKVVELSKPGFISKEFIRKKMKKQCDYSADVPRLTMIDWEGSLGLGDTYNVQDREAPAIFILGQSGEILDSLHWWSSEENIGELIDAVAKATGK